MNKGQKTAFVDDILRTADGIAQDLGYEYAEQKYPMAQRYAVRAILQDWLEKDFRDITAEDIGSAASIHLFGTYAGTYEPHNGIFHRALKCPEDLADFLEKNTMDDIRVMLVFNNGGTKAENVAVDTLYTGDIIQRIALCEYVEANLDRHYHPDKYFSKTPEKVYEESLKRILDRFAEEKVYELNQD